MTKEQFSNLSKGDLIRHKSQSFAYLVDDNYGDHVTIVRTSEATNPEEWTLVYKANYTKPEDS